MFIFSCWVVLLRWGASTEYYDTAVEPAGLLIPLTIVVFISIAKDGVEDYKRKQADNKTNNRMTRIVLSDGTIREVAWKEVEVGSLMLLFNDEEVPADAVLLDCGGSQGPTAYVETAAIDGETNLKIRLPAIRQCSTGTEGESHSLVYSTSKGSPSGLGIVEGLGNMKMMYHVELPNGSIHSFSGSMESEFTKEEGGSTYRSEITLTEKNVFLRGSVIRATGWAICAVVYTGKDTKLSRNSKSPPSKLSVVDSVVNRTLIIAIGCMITVCCLSALFAMTWQNRNNDADYLCLHEGDMDNRYTSNSGCESGTTSSTLLILTFATLYNNFVAISMYVSLEMVYLWQAYFITQDLSIYDPESDSPAEAHTSGMCADVGQVQFVLSDKTGTLTKNVMRLRRCSVAGMLYGAPTMIGGARGSDRSSDLRMLSKDSFTDSVLTTDQAGVWSKLSALNRFHSSPPSNDNSILESFMHNMSVCNTVMLMASRQTGELNVTDMLSLKKCLEAESPDEVALVLGAADANILLVKRDTDIAQIVGQDGYEAKFKILAVNEFDSARKRMSIIVRVAIPQKSQEGNDAKSNVDKEEWGPPILFCKGADSSVFSHCASGGYMETCKVHVNEFASTGLRTLVMCKRELSEEEFTSWIARYDVASKSLSNRKEMLRRCAEDVEENMSLLGAVGIEDELQDGVPNCIDLLSRAGINMWMITGDKPETAVAIGRMCGLLRPQHELEMMVNVTGGDKLRLRLTELLQYFEKKQQLLAESNPNSTETASVRSLGIFSWNKFRDRYKNGEIEEETDSDDVTGMRKSSISFTRLSTYLSHTNSRNHLKNDQALQSDRTNSKYSVLTEIALVIDGQALEAIWNDSKALEMFRVLVRLMSTVIACRVSPLQKASLVRLIKTGEGKPVTLAIGDGANDIGMINEAKVGVGICGKEGRHAANSADFAIGQFRFLAPLILKHGRYNYIRCAKLVLYCFFKNLVLVSSLFYFCLYSGFSGMMPLDSIIFSGFNFYLGLPILCIGIYDIDVPYEVVVAFPFLAHATGRRRELLNMKTMLRWCILAFVEGLVLFSVVIRVIGGSTEPGASETGGHSLQGVGVNDSDGKAGGIYVEGFLLYCCVIVAMVYKVCSMTYTWNAFHHISHFLSMSGFLLFVYVYSLIEEIPEWYGVTEFALGLPAFWLALLLVPTAICIMDNVVEWSFAQMFPTSQNKLECISQDFDAVKALLTTRDTQKSLYSEDPRKSAKSMKLTPTSSDNEGEFSY